MPAPVADISNTNRWRIALLGVLLQLCLGTVYAWSYFQKPLVQVFQCGNCPVAWIFSLAILFLSLGAALGGVLLTRFGPRRLAVIGGALFGSSYLLSALALYLHSLPLMYLGYGIIGGTGLGLGYVTPVATVARWFPDRKGLLTGMVVMGFGFGALLMSKVLAPAMMYLTGNNLELVFAGLGLFFLLVTIPVASGLINPPVGYTPPGYQPPPQPATTSFGRGETSRQALASLQFALMWFIFFCNITAGIMFIGFQSPMLQEILKRLHTEARPEYLAAAGATLIAVSSVFNGVGRLFWGGVSDRIGRIQTFRVMLGTQILIFGALIWMGSNANPWVFSALVCYVLFCYGGGFGTMPALVLDVFGLDRMVVVYGWILTAWGCGGIAGPQLVALIKDHFAERASVYSFGIGTGLLACGFLLSLALRNTRQRFRKPGRS